MIKMWILCVSVVVILARKSNAESHNYCIDLKPQTSLDIEQLMGMWYGIEVIQHQEQTPGRWEPDQEAACPVIMIREFDPDYEHNFNRDPNYRHSYDYSSSDSFTPVTGDLGTRNGRSRSKTLSDRERERRAWRNLTLMWDEGKDNIEYFLKYEPSRPGFWISSGPQNGSLLDRKYNSFAGHVQVLKAVGTHLVLTFCHIMPASELFTVVLSRDPYLSTTEITGVHNLIQRKHMQTHGVHRGCTPSMGVISTPQPMVLIWALVYGLGVGTVLRKCCL